MTLKQLSCFTFLRQQAPMPWHLDQDNAKGVCVKDSRGYIVFFESFEDWPDEMTSAIIEGIVSRARSVAHWLVAWSEDPFGNGKDFTEGSP